MSTRPATRSQQAARVEAPPQEQEASSVDEKENIRLKGTSGRSRVTRKALKTYCICKKPDDGSPMIHCASCKDWFHFRCVELSDRDAEEIQLYICPSCHQKTGSRTIKEWEGTDALKEFTSQAVSTKTSSSSAGKKKSNRKQADTKAKGPESDTCSEGSDEYDPEVESGPKRSAHRQAYRSDESESESSHGGKSPKRLRRGSNLLKEPLPRKESSPTPVAQSKRKTPALTQSQHPSKRPRSESTAGEDAVRKYCLGKLQELFCQIFVRYPFLHSSSDAGSGSELELHPLKKPEELTSEEKEQLEAKAKLFGNELEQSIYELYSELDKQGKQVAAGKYKERFRMLTFNLSKADRVVLHMRIASSRISPKELSTMSSTDLASEEEQQSIKKLEEEALAHSILKKSTVPRAKLTHKGLQDIEDVTGAGRREAEREREEEEEERIERERLARLRQQAQRAQSQGSAPPESPVVPQNPAWGAPPPVPLHAAPAADPSSSSPSIGRPPAHPLFVPSASDFAAAGPLENELNLADLINIDEEPSGEIAMTPVDPVATPFGEAPPLLADATSQQASPTTASPVTPSITGISPFAAKGSQPDLSSRPSFDLNAIWTPSSADASTEGQAEPEPQDEPMVTDQPGEGVFAPEADDQDFDMFLNANDQESAAEPSPNEPIKPDEEVKQTPLEDQLPIWTGTVSMPLDSAIPQEVAVVARQAGGRTLGSDSPLWQTLFPSRELRIDGRVPVEKSAQYITQVRLNPTKELVAAAFSSAQGNDPSGFHAVKNHLLSKGRHGLIFPWGHNPKSSAPGRELYVVPLLSTDPIPEYMELLDELQILPSRNVDYLIGIWVLNKGKLSPPKALPASTTHTPTPTPAPISTPSVAQAPTVAPTSGVPNIDFAQLKQLGLIPQPPQPSQLPPPPPQHAVTAPTSTPQPTIPVPPSNSNLAAEVSQLTPEQIQLMLQTLAKTSQAVPGQPVPPQPYGATHPLPSQLVPPPQPIALPQAALQPWTNQGPQYPGSYQHQPQPYPGPPPPHQTYGGDRPYGERYDNNRPYGNDYSYDRGGYRGRGRGRGNWQKGRGRGGQNGPAQRNRGRGGGGWGGDQR
ncbi:hypothetical protein C8Q79DRAFT_974759 [Trametes meyenii]|nr:hypothetical protein C8Q79DRAFT_974759 [Trametes meyenii]